MFKYFVALLVFVALSGCRLSPEAIVYKSASTAYKTAGTCHTSLNAADEIKQTEVRRLAVAGDKAGATNALERWLAVHASLFLTCETIRALGKAGEELGVLLSKGKPTRQKAMQFAADVTTAIVRVGAAFANAGIEYKESTNGIR